MTRKEDLILEAEQLGINVAKKDTINILCEKINEAGITSKNCNTKKSAATKKTVGRPSKSPKTKSPKTKSPKTKSPKSKSPKTKSPKSKSPKSKSPKGKSNTTAINFIHYGKSEVQLNIKNESGHISGDEVLETLGHISHLLNNKYTVRENDNIINLEDYNDTKGQVYTIGKYTQNKTKNVQEPHIDMGGINKYMEMGKLDIVGAIDRIILKKKDIIFSDPLDLFNTDFRNTVFIFHSPNNNQYYRLNIDLLYSEKGKYNFPMYFLTNFAKIDKKSADRLIFKNFHSDGVPTIKSERIVFSGYGKKANINFYFDAKDIKNFYILPQFLINQIKQDSVR